MPTPWIAARLWLPVVAALCLLAAPLLAAEHPLYAFVDAQGVLHITDRLGDVPQPYYEAYKQQEAKRAALPGAPVNGPLRQAPQRPDTRIETTTAAVPAAQAQASARQQWQQLMASWRDKLTSSAQALQQAEAEAQGANNPVLRETPAGRERLQAAQLQVAQWRGRAVEARRMLTETLPARAKREHVPPQWLLP